MNPLDDNCEQAAFEQYLRSFKPNAAKVDVAQLNLPSDGSAPIKGSVPNHSGSHWPTVAAAWLCGAACGMGLMFLISRQTQPTVAAIPLAPMSTDVASALSTSIKPIEGDQIPYRQPVIVDRPQTQSDAAGLPRPVPASFPDLIMSAQQSPVLHARSFWDSGKPRSDGNEVVVGNARSLNLQPSNTFSEVLQSIQIPGANDATRKSLLEELLYTRNNI